MARRFAYIDRKKCCIAKRQDSVLVSMFPSRSRGFFLVCSWLAVELESVLSLAVSGVKAADTPVARKA
jgi:hypothetical protein